jgi:hypothetical protein
MTIGRGGLEKSPGHLKATRGKYIIMCVTRWRTLTAHHVVPGSVPGASALVLPSPALSHTIPILPQGVSSHLFFFSAFKQAFTLTSPALSPIWQTTPSPRTLFTVSLSYQTAHQRLSTQRSAADAACQCIYELQSAKPSCSVHWLNARSRSGVVSCKSATKSKNTANAISRLGRATSKACWRNTVLDGADLCHNCIGELAV